MKEIEKQLPNPNDYQDGFVYCIVQLIDDLTPTKALIPDGNIKTREHYYENINQQRWVFLYSKDM